VRKDNNYEIITPERWRRVALIMTTLRKERGMWGKGFSLQETKKKKTK